MNRYVVYTVIFNDYDTLKAPISVSDKIDYICFTDNPRLKSKYWKILFVKCISNDFSLENRRLKLLAPYEELKEYEISMYVDGSILIKQDLIHLFEGFQENKLVNFRHPSRNCVFDEIISCINEKKGNVKKLVEQYAEYKFQGMPEKYGLSDNKIILRSHKSDIVKKIMYEWFDQVMISGRDQTCLSFVLFKNSYNYEYFNIDILDNPYFETWPHKKESFRMLWRKFKYIGMNMPILRAFILFLNTSIKPVYMKYHYGNN